MAKTKAKKPFLSIRLDPKIRKRLDDAAQADGLRVSDFLRRLIIKNVGANGNTTGRA